MFDSTILENIIDNKIFSKSRLNKIIETCALKDILDNCQNGIKTHVGEFGKEFSGGQVQRILLARALYSGTSLLVIDEGTSALDENNENQIIQSLEPH